MSNKPIFVATHPRACSTAFERVFMTRRDILQCAHEPFGDSFYYGPERLSERYAQNEAARESSGFSKTTYKDVVDRLEREGSKGKRVLIKDMAYYLMPPDGKAATLAPSVATEKTMGSANGDKQVNGTASNGIKADGNPTVLPLDVLRKYHFTFLIRHPRRGIPSFYRCTVPPLDEITGFASFMPNEAGYLELRTLFDYLRKQNIVGPSLAPGAEAPMSGATNGATNGITNGVAKDQINITVIDADDLLDKPQEVIQAFCRETGIEFHPDMLSWDNPEDQEYVERAFEKWIGFHNDAIQSTSLSPRKTHHKVSCVVTEDNEWREKYGEEGQKIIRDCVNENIPHYQYLKSFAIKF
ncbi:uncharacterized protein BCR38DRAFT_86967 [Pseudomassariella vexata]|uniref:P-loop containing nucleoside triphosphate hydrolase protein n=1 Tax=Pseudomassariella vexata TaxID=1141098 RepID=A0A1Y2EFD4_9PEZI|nr:uncharacterized protein BCR38DRAFT_86967 [Pseudomassariella vexata]ORY69515.1 hypothetical protein BCR38DRAFT_86967 [Pseudomassariella vexata]